MTNTKLARVQVQELDLPNPQLKVIVADSCYEERYFLGVFEPLQHTCG